MSGANTLLIQYHTPTALTSPLCEPNAFISSPRTVVEGQRTSQCGWVETAADVKIAAIVCGRQQ